MNSINNFKIGFFCEELAASIIMLSLYDKITCESINKLKWIKLSNLLNRMTERFDMKKCEKDDKFTFKFDPSLQLELEKKKSMNKKNKNKNLTENEQKENDKKRIKELKKINDSVSKYSLNQIKMRLVQIIRRSIDKEFTAEEFIIYANYGIGFFHTQLNYEGGDILIPSIVYDSTDKKKIIDYVFVSIQIKKTKNSADISDVKVALSGVKAPFVKIGDIIVKCFPIILYFFTSKYFINNNLI